MDSPLSETVSLLASSSDQDTLDELGNPQGGEISTIHSDNTSDVKVNDVGTMEYNKVVKTDTNSDESPDGIPPKRVENEDDELIDMTLDSGESDSDEVDEEDELDLFIDEDVVDDSHGEADLEGENSPLLKCDSNSSSLSSKGSPNLDSGTYLSLPKNDTIPPVITGDSSSQNDISPKHEPSINDIALQEDSSPELSASTQGLGSANNDIVSSVNDWPTASTSETDSCSTKGSEGGNDIHPFKDNDTTNNKLNVTDGVPSTTEITKDPGGEFEHTPTLYHGNEDIHKDTDNETNIAAPICQQHDSDEVFSKDDITKKPSEYPAANTKTCLSLSPELDTASVDSEDYMKKVNGGIIRNDNGCKNSMKKMNDMQNEDEIKTLSTVVPEDENDKVTMMEQNDTDNNEMSQKTERFRFQNVNLPFWKAKTKIEDSGHKVDTPIVPTLPDIKSNEGNKNGTGDNVLSNGDKIDDASFEGIANDDFLQSKDNSEISEKEKTKEAIANILHEIDMFASGQDFLFDLDNGGTNRASSLSTSQYSESTTSPQNVVSAPDSLTPSFSDKSKKSPNDPFEFPEILLQPPLVRSGDDNVDSGFIQENDDGSFVSEECTKLLPRKDVSKENRFNGSSNTNENNGTKYSSIDHIKTDFLRAPHRLENGDKERPKSGSSALAKFMQMFPLRKHDDDEKSKRPISEEIKKTSNPIKFFSLSDDHSRNRGVFSSREGDDLNELLGYCRELQHNQSETEGGQTNRGFEGETGTDVSDLEQILLNLSEQLKNIKSMSEENGLDENDRRIQKTKSDLLESLRLLQQTLKNSERDQDLLDENSDETSPLNQEQDLELAQDDVVDLPDDLNSSREKPSEDDNLSLEFFLPGSKKKFRLHRQTFIVFVLKYSIFWFSFLFWFCSLSGFSFGTWMLTKESAVVIDDASDVFLDPYALLCFVAGIIFIVAFFGCVGALRENICLLKIFHLSLAFVFGFEVLVGALVFLFFTLPEFRRALKVGPEEVLRLAVINYFDDEGKKKWIDRLQKEFQCCGVSLSDEGYLDWQDNIYFNCTSPSVYRCSVPLSCCIFEKDDFIDYMCGADIIKKEESYVKRYIYTKGCMKSLGEWLADNNSVIAYIALGVIIPQILSVIEARYYISILRRQARECPVEEGFDLESQEDYEDEGEDDGVNDGDDDYEDDNEADDEVFDSPMCRSSPPQQAPNSLKRGAERISTMVKSLFRA